MALELATMILALSYARRAGLGKREVLLGICGGRLYWAAPSSSFLRYSEQPVCFPADAALPSDAPPQRNLSLTGRRQSGTIDPRAET